MIIPGFPVLIAPAGFTFIGASTESVGAESSSSLSFNISPHVDTQEGDYMLMFTIRGGSGNGTPNNGIGWSNLNSNAGIFIGSQLSQRVAVSDGESYSVASGSAYYLICVILTFRKAATSPDFEVSGSNTPLPSPIVLDGLSDVAAGSKLICLLGVASSTASAPVITAPPVGTQVVAYESQAGVYSGAIMSAIRENMPPGPTGTQSFTTSGSYRTIGVVASVEKG